MVSRVACGREREWGVSAYWEYYILPFLYEDFISGLTLIRSRFTALESATSDTDMCALAVLYIR